MCKDTLLKRARAKYLSKEFALRLVKHNRGSELEKSYRNTIYCNHNLLNKDGKITATYCKNRWCAVCNRIRTGNLINGYAEQLNALSDPQFVTLTVPTCYGDYLPLRIKEMQKTFTSIRDLTRKAKYKKEIGKDFKGLRKAECTIRPRRKYHYHYHLVLEHLEVAEWLVEQWLKRFPQADIKGQDITKADNRSIKELFKYFTKVTHKGKIVDYKRLDVIFTAMRGVRVFQPFGGFKKVDEDIIDELVPTVEVPKDIMGTRFTWDEFDWISEYGELLTGYEPTEKLKELFKDEK